MRRYLALILAVPALILAGCGGGGGVTQPPPPALFTISLSSASVKLYPASAATDVVVSVNRNGNAGSMTLSVAGLPTGAAASVTNPGTNNSGSISISPGTAAAGSYNLSVRCSDGTSSVSSVLSLVIGVAATVENAGGGRLDLFMSTSFQPAEWNYQFFANFPNAAMSLNDLGPQHIRLQPVVQGVPQRGLGTWDFSKLDAVVNPVFTATDHSPQFQIAVAPAFMYDANHKLSDLTFQQFAEYSAQLVRYYNTGGFTAPDGFHASSSGYPITYWGVFNEPNINNLTPAEYTALYNKTVPAMQAVDPNVKFVAIELSDWGSENTRYVPTFVDNVTTQVDVMATHFYSTCNQRDTDQQLFNTVPDFANRVSYLYSAMAVNPALTNVPVWITENNVNADWDRGGGISQCNGTPFVADQRGSSSYFAAWRPYMFSQVGKAGAKALYTWVFAGDLQYGELNDQTGKPRLSYWVDYYLTHFFPSPPGADILQSSTTADTDVEVLAARNPNRSVLIMVANRAVASASDNNGAGSPRTISVDVSQLGTFTSAKLLAIDARTDISNGPVETPLNIGPAFELTFPGYGVAFVTLQ